MDPNGWMESNGTEDAVPRVARHDGKLMRMPSTTGSTKAETTMWEDDHGVVANMASWLPMSTRNLVMMASPLENADGVPTATTQVNDWALQLPSMDPPLQHELLGGCQQQPQLVPPWTSLNSSVDQRLYEIEQRTNQLLQRWCLKGPPGVVDSSHQPPPRRTPNLMAALVPVKQPKAIEPGYLANCIPRGSHSSIDHVPAKPTPSTKPPRPSAIVAALPLVQLPSSACDGLPDPESLTQADHKSAQPRSTDSHLAVQTGDPYVDRLTPCDGEIEAKNESFVSKQVISASQSRVIDRSSDFESLSSMPHMETCIDQRLPVDAAAKPISLHDATFVPLAGPVAVSEHNHVTKRELVAANLHQSSKCVSLFTTFAQQVTENSDDAFKEGLKKMQDLVKAGALDDATRSKLQSYQTRLVLLRHAMWCSKHEGTCAVMLQCADMKSLLRHMAACRSSTSCAHAACRSSKFLLFHFHQCSLVRCAICEVARFPMEVLDKNGAMMDAAKTTQLVALATPKRKRDQEKQDESRQKRQRR